MRLIITPQADEDLQGHIAYTAQHDPDAAERILVRIIERLRSLAEYPMMGKPGRLPETRELVITDTRYVAVYEILAETVYILHINHGRQQWPREEDAGDL
jgi:plasmid stabilization system protein ParE